VIEHNYAVVNGLRLHYASAGQGPLMLFLHGFPEFWYAWKNQLAEFGRDHHAVAPDMRGYNVSEKPDALEQYHMSALVEDVRALAGHLSPERRFILVGHDWGGAVAWAFAIEHADRLDRLVIVNAPHPGVFARLLIADEEQQAASQYMLMFRGGEAESLLSTGNFAFLAQIVFGTGAFSEEDQRAYLEAWSQPGAITGGLNYYRANHVGPPSDAGGRSTGNFALDPTRLRVDVPTLVIWGEKDRALLPQNLDGLERFVPQLTIKRIPEASHWVVHEKPAEVNAHIREFIGQSQAAA
jgi:pimeloyl-ACP methyl ester carboxylesterase